MVSLSYAHFLKEFLKDYKAWSFFFTATSLFCRRQSSFCSLCSSTYRMPWLRVPWICQDLPCHLPVMSPSRGKTVVFSTTTSMYMSASMVPSTLQRPPIVGISISFPTALLVTAISTAASLIGLAMLKNQRPKNKIQKRD